mmetsp:Transcript_153790/g.269006  ORF Transcript_153790/g.269006 Transcript_153790/m.269006 type:complete len:1158 (-) Transcript_153790:582-4055(-)
MSAKKFPTDYAALEKEKSLEEITALWHEVAHVAASLVSQIDENGCFPDASHVATISSIIDLVFSYLKFTSPKKDDEASIEDEDGALHPVHPPVIEEAIKDLNEAMKGIDDEQIRCKIFYIMESCLLDQRVPVEDIVANTLLVAVHHSLNPPNIKEHKAWIKKCWNLAEFFDMIDFSSCTEFYHTTLLLARPDIMNVDEGRKMVASLFLLSPRTTMDLHQILKRSLLDYQRRSIWENIGDVYYRAYVMSDGIVRLKLEEMVQWYMEAAVKCQDEKMFVRLLCVLDAFHAAKDDKVVMGLLDRGYGPVLFRALDYPNDILRRNALRVYANAFPIRNPMETRQETGKRVEEQLVKLATFLEDKNPSIRADAIEALCGVLRRHWALIGMVSALPILDKIFKESVNDCSNKTVRLAVLKGAEILMDYDVTHQYLKPLIPRLGCCLNDTASIVRLAFARLLKNIARIRHIAFWEAAPMPKLVERMGRDPCDGVVDELISLLLTNFLPANMEPTEQLKRCVFLTKLDRIAAMQFYCRARRHCKDPQGAFSLLVILTNWAHSCMEARKKQGAPSVEAEPASRQSKKAKGNSKKKGAEAAPQADGAVAEADSTNDYIQPSRACQDEALMLSVVHVIGLLMKSLAKDWADLPPEDIKSVSKVLSSLAGSMPKVFHADDMASSCTWLAAMTPGKAADSDCSTDLCKMLNQETTDSNDCNIQWRLQLLSACMGGKLNEVLRSIQEHLQSGRSGKRNIVALRFLTYLLVNQQTRPKLLSEWVSDDSGPLRSIARALHDYVTSRLPELLTAEGSGAAERAYAVTACNVLSRLVLHAQYLESEDAGNSARPKPKTPKKARKRTTAAVDDATLGALGVFSPIDLMHFYSKDLLPLCVDCYTIAGDAPAQPKTKKRTRQQQPEASSKDSVLDDFKAQLCESVTGWIGEMDRCGLLKESAQPSPEEGDGPAQSVPAPEEVMLALPLDIIRQLCRTGSRCVRQRLLQLIYKLQFGFTDAASRAALIQAAVQLLKGLGAAALANADADYEGLVNMALGMARIMRTNERDAKVFFAELLEASVEVVKAHPEGLQLDSEEQVVPRVVRVFKKACGCPEYRKLLHKYVNEVQRQTTTVRDVEVLSKLWRYLRTPDSGDESESTGGGGAEGSDPLEVAVEC